MILNNTQANIFKVNGGLADNFANRPAANGSFYLFYSIDTQEIYYDNGAWVLIGSSGGGGVNIYNSDGTLTGNRTLNGANFDLTFSNINSFRVQDNLGNTGLIIECNNFNYVLGDYSGNNIGNIFVQINQGSFTLFDNYSGLDYFNISNITSSKNVNFTIDVDNEIIKTLHNYNDIGLKLDFANSVYQFGQINAGNITYLTINDTNQTISTFHNNNNKGLNFQYQAQRYNFGHIANNGLTLQIENATSQLTVLCNPVQSGGSSNGLFLDLTNNRNYLFGQFNGGSQTHLRVSDLNSQITANFSGSINGINLRQSSHTFGFISGSQTNTLRFNSNLTVGFYYNNLLNGLNIQHESTISGLERYDFGKLYGASNTQYKITLTDSACFLNYKQIAQMGFTATQAEFGYYAGSGSNILLDSSGNINLRQLTQILINGTGITQGTSGSVSGQHLKVKINNVDYVIELRNP